MKLPDFITPARRRFFAALLMVVGAVTMLMAPETWAGTLLLALGVAIELAGMALGHRETR